MSVIAALCVPPSRTRVHLSCRLHPNTTLTAVEVVAFLRPLRHHLGGPMVLLWDRLPAHRAGSVHAFLTPASRIHPVFFPPSAPELNPSEYAWGSLKGTPLANWAPLDVETLVPGARRAQRGLQRHPALLRSFIRHSPLFVHLK